MIVMKTDYHKARKHNQPIHFSNENPYVTIPISERQAAESDCSQNKKYTKILR